MLRTDDCPFGWRVVCRYVYFRAWRFSPTLFLFPSRIYTLALSPGAKKRTERKGQDVERRASVAARARELRRRSRQSYGQKEGMLLEDELRFDE